MVGAEHYAGRAPGAEDPAALQGAARHHRHPRHGRAVRGRQADRVARAQDPALPVAAVPRGRDLHRPPGKYVEIKDTVRGFKEIIDGKCDDIPEQAFYMMGGIDDVRARAEKMAKEKLVALACT